MGEPARVLPLPGLRYAHLRALQQGLADLVEHGCMFFPADPQRIVIDFQESNHVYKIDGERVPSVTTLLDSTELSPGLPWWAYRIGLAYAIRAIHENRLTYGQLQAWSWEPVIKPADHLDHPDVTLSKPRKGLGKPKHAIEHLAMELRHHPNAMRDDKGTLGTSIHVAAEKAAITGAVEGIGEFPEADRGYVQALARYFLEQEPEVQHSEVIVGSKRFGFAGRFDTIVRTPAGERRGRDYKTSGGVYPKFDKQMSLYDLAICDMGLEPPEGWDIVHLMPNGDYAVIPCTIDHGDALVALLKHTQDKDQEQRLKALGRST